VLSISQQEERFAVIGPGEVAIAMVVIGGPTWVVSNFVNKVFGSRHKHAQMEARMAQDRAQLLEAQLVDAHRQNEQLQRQLEWHAKMVETQDTLVKQLTDGQSPATARATAGSVR
jgi:hypothetical protein